MISDAAKRKEGGFIVMINLTSRSIQDDLVNGNQRTFRYATSLQAPNVTSHKETIVSTVDEAYGYLGTVSHDAWKDGDLSGWWIEFPITEAGTCGCSGRSV